MSEERRYGKPRSNAERQLRHYERTGQLLPIDQLPPRGTGFRTWKSRSTRPRPRPLKEQRRQSRR